MLGEKDVMYYFFKFEPHAFKHDTGLLMCMGMDESYFKLTYAGFRAKRADDHR